MTEAETTSTKCVLCDRTLRDDETMTCLRCVRRLDETLESIVETYALLPWVMLPGSVPPDDMPHGKRVDAPSPVRLEVLDSLDGRPGYSRATGAQIGLHGVVGILESWGRLVREERRLSPPDREPTVAGEVELLRRHLSWICERPWVDELHDETKTLLRDLRRVAGEPTERPIGACPAERIENGKVVTCGAALWAPTTGDTVQCRRCKASWERERWLILGKIIEESA